MITVSKVEAGHYAVSDGRTILKQGKGWYILQKDGDLDFGPVTTLASAKEYVTTGSVLLAQHNLGSGHGRKQSRKEYNAYLAAEAKKGNYLPLVITLSIMALLGFLIEISKQG